ncbi:MAG: diacylglycerol kinase family protein [Lachnospiraceae bacterium]|nr:diacylglycerol kinase family protein [Lachnospiraceae bacterium]
MNQYAILYNPLANNGQGEKAAEALKSLLPNDDLSFINIRTVTDYQAFFKELDPGAKPVLVGGDGTLSYFINHYDVDSLDREVYYYPAGSGNDFYNDVKEKEPDLPLLLNPYLKDLPIATVKGKEYRVLNGVGYGIDGYCCEVGDEMRQKSDKPVNYAGIAIKGLLFHYKTTNATVIIDGVERRFPKCWLAPTMNGRFYGGGMNATPDQDRLNPERTLSTLLFFGSGKIKTLMIFPNIFKGTHVKHSDCVLVFTGKEVTVRFDRPTALQVDGETVKDVTEYTMRAVK